MKLHEPEFPGLDSTTYKPWRIVGNTVASGESFIDFTGLGQAEYLIDIKAAVPAVDEANMKLRVSDDNGLTFKQGASDYIWTFQSTTPGGTNQITALTELSIQLNRAGAGEQIGNGTGENFNCRLWIHDMGSSTSMFTVHWTAGFISETGVTVTANGTGRYVADLRKFNAIRFFMSNGNTTSGKFVVYKISE